MQQWRQPADRSLPGLFSCSSHLQHCGGFHGNNSETEGKRSVDCDCGWDVEMKGTVRREKMDEGFVLVKFPACKLIKQWNTFHPKDIVENLLSVLFIIL